MTKSPLNYRAIYTKAGAVALAFFVSVNAGSAMAQTDSRALLDRLTQLEIQVQQLSRSGGYVPGAVTSSLGALGGGDDRVADMERQIRDLTDKVERANFQNQQLQTDLDKMKSDNDVRFGLLEKKPISPQAQTEAPHTLTGEGPVADNASTQDETAPEVAATATPEAAYQKAYAALQQKDYPAAEKGFRDFLAKNPNHTLAANAQYWLGESYYARGNYKAAASVFAESYQKYPKAQKAPDSLLKMGLSLSQQKRTKEACIVLRQLTKDYPAAANSIATKAESEIKTLKCQ